MHTEGNNLNFAQAVVDSKLPVVIQEQDTGAARGSSEKISVVFKNRT